MAEEDPTARRPGFGTIVITGLAGAALTAVAASKTWFRAAVDQDLAVGVRGPDRGADMPLALALALVVLAAWGALLVTRGRLRRVVAGLGLLAAAGVVACAVAAPFTLPDQVRENVLAGSGDVAVSPTGWYVTACVASVVALVVLVVAWRRVPTWPEMGSRYDAPSTRSAERGDTDLWRALDEGRDPTDPADPPAS